MIVSSRYSDELQKNSTKPVSSPNVNQYYKNLGISFEFMVNKELMKLKEFFLYWKAPITLKKPIQWTLCGDFVQDINITVKKEERNKFLIDHVLITPYAVVILEANTYGKRPYQISGNEWNYKNADGFYQLLPNPQSRMRLYVALMQQILDYYSVILPVIGKVVLMNDLDLAFLKERTDDFVHFDNLVSCIKAMAEEAPSKHVQALKLIKSFYFDGLFPIAYDGNISNWSGRNGL